MTQPIWKTNRPAPTEADQAHWARVGTPVGPVLEGTVVQISRELGTGVAREIGTGHVFALVERVVSTPVFHSLEVGSPIRFQENGKNVVARIQATELKG